MASIPNVGHALRACMPARSAGPTATSEFAVILSRAAGATKNRVALVARPIALLRHAILRQLRGLRTTGRENGRPAGGRYEKTVGTAPRRGGSQ